MGSQLNDPAERHANIRTRELIAAAMVSATHDPAVFSILNDAYMTITDRLGDLSDAEMELVKSARYNNFALEVFA